MGMDPLRNPYGKSRPKLRGPRPAALKLSQDSITIKKPPVAPRTVELESQPSRNPVIIYNVSPKIIQADPSQFMSIVQKLTGPSDNNDSDHHAFVSGPVSPAATFASIEKTRNSDGGTVKWESLHLDESLEIGPICDRSNPNHGVLSPAPCSLPMPVHQNLFTPTPDFSVEFFDLSSLLHTSTIQMLDGMITPSPIAALLASLASLASSPNLSIDPFA